MIGTIIVARTNSSRLPNKILINIKKNLKVIDILIKRAKKIGKPIILATTKLKSDNELCTYVKKNYKSVLIFRGENKNKLKRWYDCFIKYKLSYASIIDGDDVFFDFSKYKTEINKKKKYDIISCKKDLITGLFTHIISLKALSKMKNFYKKNYDTEMIDNFLKLSKINREYIDSNKIFNKKKIRLTLDYQEDLTLMRHICDIFEPLTESEKIVKYLIKNNHIKNINYFRENYWRNNQKNKNKSVIKKFKSN